MKTAVIYARYSSNNQTEQSIEGQVRDCNEYAARNDILVVGTYIDRAMTGTNDNREQFQKMLKDSDKKAWNYVLVYKLDRFSRNKYETAIHRKHLKDNGIKILSAKENIPETPEGVLLESLLEGMNQYFSEELSQKTRRGLRETCIKGNFPGGRINYGYEVKDHKVVIIEEEAEVVRQIFADYANGKRLCDIMRDLKEKCVTHNGKTLPKCVVLYMLKQERYTGVYINHGVVYDNIFPAIVPKDVFEAVQKRINANKYGKRSKEVDYLLRGKAYCGYCGKRLVSDTGTSKSGKVWRYYKCVGTKKITGCTYERIGKEALEEVVTQALTKAIKDEKNFALLLSGIIEHHKKMLANDNSLKLYEKELAKTKKATSNLLAAIEAGVYTDTTKERLQELEAQQRQLEENILIEKSKVKVAPSEKDLSKYLKHAIQQVPQKIVDLLIDKVIVYNDKIIIYPKYLGITHDDETPDGQSDRGLLLLSVSMFYEKKIMRRGPKKAGATLFEMREIAVEIMI